MLILDLWGISFHPVVVVGLGNDLLFNFIIGHCAIDCKETRKKKHRQKNLAKGCVISVKIFTVQSVH